MPEVRPVPSEFGSIVVQLIVSNARAAIEFYRLAFDANELFRHEWPDDPRIFHCELLIGSGRILLQDEFPERRLLAPTTLGSSPTTIHLYVPDAATTFLAAVAAGGRMVSPVERRFWGVVCGVLEDPFGHRWIISTRVEDLDPEELARRAADTPMDRRLPIGPDGGRG
jgi:PhnB protein